MDGGTSEQSDANGSPLNGWKEDPVEDDLSHKTDDSPVPGTSKSSGICRRTSKEPKRSSPDQAEGHFMMMLCVNLYFTFIGIRDCQKKIEWT